MRPWLISRMFEVIDSISCRTWLETTTLRPALPQSWISRMVLRRAIGSIPESGSSRINRSGSWAIAGAVQPHERDQPLEPGHALVKGVLFGAEADLEVERRVAPDLLAEHEDRP